MDSFCVGIYPADALQRARKNVTSSVHRIQSVINVSRKWNLKALKKTKESEWEEKPIKYCLYSCMTLYLLSTWL